MTPGGEAAPARKSAGAARAARRASKGWKSVTGRRPGADSGGAGAAPGAAPGPRRAGRVSGEARRSGDPGHLHGLVVVLGDFAPVHVLEEGFDVVRPGRAVVHEVGVLVDVE